MTNKTMAGLMNAVHGTLNLSHIRPIHSDELSWFEDEKMREHLYYNEHNPLQKYLYFDGLLILDIIDIDNLVESSSESTEESMFSYKNQKLRIKIQLQQLQSFVDDRDYPTLMEFVDKKIGFITYVQLFDEIPDEQKYDAFINFYIRAEFGFSMMKDYYADIFKYADLSKERLKRIEKLKKYVDENDELTIYHGQSFDQPAYDFYSWTLNKRVAKFFAERYSKKGIIRKKKIKIYEAIDYITTRDEEEIIYNWDGEETNL